MDIISEEKQIEEMTKILQFDACFDVGINHCRKMDDCNICKATCIYEAGYRKQSEGEWISNELGGYKYAFYCSECGWVDGYPFNDRHKYCPNCGAKMTKGE